MTVTATDGVSGVPDGTEVRLDVDLNNDGDFVDPGEASYTVSSLTGGSTTFVVQPDLAAGRYALRARVTDVAGNEGVSATKELIRLDGTDDADERNDHEAHHDLQ